MRFGPRSTLALLGILLVVPASARERNAPALVPTLGGIGVLIKPKGPTPLSATPCAITAFFVRADSGDVLRATDILASNYSGRNQVYLLNVPPGKYVVVGAYTEGWTGSKTTPGLPSATIYFDKEMIPATEIIVEAGKIAFMGRILVKVSVGMGNADETQNHYADLVGRGMAFSVTYGVNVNASRTMSQTMSPKVSFTPTILVGVTHVTRAGKLDLLDRKPATERDFWRLANKNVFANEPDWQELTRRRLEALN